MERNSVPDNHFEGVGFDYVISILNLGFVIKKCFEVIWKQIRIVIIILKELDLNIGFYDQDMIGNRMKTNCLLRILLKR